MGINGIVATPTIESGRNLTPEPSHMKVKSEKGFMLIELIMTILILAILSALISLSLTGLATARLDQASNKVIADLRYVQQLAISTQTRHGLTIAAGGTGYSAHIEGGVAPFLCGGEKCIPDPVNLGQDFIVDFNTYQQGQLSGIIFSPAAPVCSGPGNNVVEFNSIGAPTDTKGTVLTCNSTLTLSYGGYTRTIIIQEKTGNLT